MKNLPPMKVAAFCGVVAIAVTIVTAAAADIADTQRYDADLAASQLQVDGTSSLHDWEVMTHTVKGYLSFHDHGAETLDAITDLTSKQTNPVLHVEVPVNTLASGENGLDKKMYKAMNTNDHPTVTYDLTTAHITGKSEDGELKLATQGVLTINGVQQTVDIPMRINSLSYNRLQISGSTDLKMTDFKVKPPTALFGTIRSGDQVTVSWTWLVVPQHEPRYAAPQSYREAVTQTLTAYEDVHAALAKGNWSQAKRSLSALGEKAGEGAAMKAPGLSADAAAAWVKSLEAVKSTSEQAAGAADLSGGRQAFEAVSQAMSRTVADFGDADDQPVLYVQCAMPGGQQDQRVWLQTDWDVRCPYMPAEKDGEPQGHVIIIDTTKQERP